MKLAIATNNPAPAALSEKETRAELAAAISDCQAAEKIVTEARVAVERTKAMIASAETSLEAATASAAKARDGAVARAISAASTGGVPMPGSTREASEARARQAEASEWADACRSALSECQKGLAEPERELSEAKEKVAKAVEAVIASQATATITKCENAMAAFALAHSTLFAVQRAWPDHSELHEMCERVLRRSPYHRVENNPVFQTWERVRERLMLDAEAELPK